VEPLYSQCEEGLAAHYSQENLGVLGAGEVDRILDAAVDRSRTTGVRLSSRVVAERVEPDYVQQSCFEQPWWRCSEPWTAVWITSAGEVRCCCLNDTSFGSLGEQPFEAIWNGAAFREFRRAHQPGNGPASCANCRRNSRTRCSPYPRAVQPITYRPVLDPVQSHEPDEGVRRLEWPLPDGIVGDPLPVTGCCGTAVGALDLEVLIDETVVADLGRRGVVDGSRLAVSIPIPFLTEGAHMLWLRPRGAAGRRGWCHRHVQFWRPEGDLPLATGLAIVPMPRARPWSNRSPTVEIADRRRPARVLRERRSLGVRGAVVVDLSTAPPGPQIVTARLGDEIIESRKVLVRSANLSHRVAPDMP